MPGTIATRHRGWPRARQPLLRVRRAESAQEQLDLVFASLGEGVVIVDALGRIVRANEAAKAIYRRIVPAERLRAGLSATQLADLFVRHDVTGRRLGRHELPISRALAGETVCEQELLVYTLDGQRLYIYTNATPLRAAGGQIIGGVAVLRDITALKVAEQLKDELVSIVSHELKTPLANIKGYTATLLRQGIVWDARTQREFLEIVDEESDKLVELIDNLLDASAIRSGAIRVRPEPVLLPRIADRAAARLRRRNPSHRIVVGFPQRFPTVLADPRRIEQVLHNLLENATKYSSIGSEISVWGRQEDEARVLIGVTDQGIGIPPEQVEQVFERFYQVDRTLTRNVSGSGLGLSICRAIVEAHGGRIWVESEPERGSVFCFTLPAVSAQADIDAGSE
ncbi:MAG: PAS domain-containing protein [Chloroflexi bacterium]|nr:PAS domain-containing protein [Chloroflexota bacterium]